jgi:hypothetical protein
MKPPAREIRLNDDFVRFDNFCSDGKYGQKHEVGKIRSIVFWILKNIPFSFSN